MIARSANRTLPGLLTALLALATSSHAQTTEPGLKARLLKAPLYLRTPWAQDNLKFDSTGNPHSKYDQTAFTLCGIDIQSVQLKKDKLQIDGRRVGLEFSPNPKRVALGDSIHIEIAGTPGADFAPALDRIFAESLSALAPSLPAYWQPYARKSLVEVPPKPTPQPSSDLSRADLSPPNEFPTEFSPGDPNPSASHANPSHTDSIHGTRHIVQPTVVSTADPGYTPAARQLKYSGKVTLRLRVRDDGSPSNVVIVTPLGLGLDEQSVAAVYRYRFKPAMEDGKPISVELAIEVAFQIF